MFDAFCLSYWYVWQVVSWHVLACLSMHRCCRNKFWSCFRRSTDMFDFCFLVYVWQVVSWHVLACLSMHRCCRNNFWSCFRRSTDMFDFCFLVYVWQVVSWHVLACLSMRRCCCFHICLTGVLLMSSGQEMTSVPQIAKMICPMDAAAWNLLKLWPNQVCHGSLNHLEWN